MKKKDLAKRIAYAGVMSAISVIVIVTSFYVKNISVTLSFISTLSLIVLLSKGYLREACLSYIATGLVAFFMGGLAFAIPYILFYGAYTLLAFLLNKYLKIKTLGYAIKSAYGAGIIVLMTYGLKLFTGNAIIEKVTEKAVYFILFTLCFVLALFIYDIILEKIVYPYVNKFIQRIDGKRNGE